MTGRIGLPVLLCVVGLLLVGCLATMQEIGVEDANLVNYALASNGATVDACQENPLHPSHTLINGVKNSDEWASGEGWEYTYQGWLAKSLNSAWYSYYVYGDRPEYSGVGLEMRAMGWLIVRFPELRHIHRVIIYTLDSVKMPARVYGVRDVWLQYAQTTGEWITVTRTNKTKRQNKNIISDNQSGEIVFEFEPVTTDKIRLAIRGTNDMKRYGQSSVSYRVAGTIRLLEIEAYGSERKPASGSERKPMATSSDVLVTIPD